MLLRMDMGSDFSSYGKIYKKNKPQTGLKYRETKCRNSRGKTPEKYQSWTNTAV